MRRQAEARPTLMPMRPCISQATILGTPFEADLPALARAGWLAVELWLTKLETYLERHSVEEARALLSENDLEAVAAASQGGLLLSRGLAREEHWGLFRRRLGLLNELGVGTLVVVADFVSDPSDDDFARAAESLAEASELAKAQGVRLALEFQKTARFCASLDTTLALIAQSGADPAGVGVCLDFFHYYTGPSKFEDLEYLSPDTLAWVQASDLSGTPRELAGDSDRIFPGEGDFRLGPIVEAIGRSGYDGFVSLELLNPQLWQIDAFAVADAGFRSMERLLTATASKSASWGGG